MSEPSAAKTTSMVAPPGLRVRRLPLLALAILALLAGVLGGLYRIGYAVPGGAYAADWLAAHGPLMVGGFLGVLISLERAVGLPDRWPYAVPVVAGMSAAFVAGGGHLRFAAVGFSLAALGFFAVTCRIVRLQPALFTRVLALGGACWLIGNLVWCAGASFPQVVPWWMAFLGLTILGERIELSRFQKPRPIAQRVLLVGLGSWIGGAGLIHFHEVLGQRVIGITLVGLALWSLAFDSARRNLNTAGLSRFMALTLLGGFVWLGVSGALWCVGAPLSTGPYYDAALHAFFLGFVFSMIFAHAPIIFPSVLGLPVAWRSRFYLHTVALHAALLLRIVGDLAEWLPGRRWGALLNALVLVAFFVNTVSAILGARRNVSATRLPRPSVTPSIAI